MVDTKLSQKRERDAKKTTYYCIP